MFLQAESRLDTAARCERDKTRANVLACLLGHTGRTTAWPSPIIWHPNPAIGRQGTDGLWLLGDNRGEGRNGERRSDHVLGLREDVGNCLLCTEDLRGPARPRLAHLA